MMEEMNEVHEFMDKIQNKDVETKWGLSVDQSLKDKVKVTILATGFGIENIDSEELGQRFKAKAEKVLTPEEAEVQAEKAALRGQYYGEDKKGGTIHRPVYSYLFKEEDLDNDDIICMVQSSPTYKRTKETLRQFNERPGLTSEDKTQATAVGVHQIEF